MTIYRRFSRFLYINPRGLNYKYSELMDDREGEDSVMEPLIYKLFIDVSVLKLSK